MSRVPATTRSDYVVVVRGSSGTTTTSQAAKLDPFYSALISGVSIAQEVGAGANEERFRELVQTAMKGVVPADPRIDIEATMLVRARKRVLDSGDWITATRIAEEANLSHTNPSARMARWKKTGDIFAIQHNGMDFYPLYALDQVDWRPRPELKPVLAVLSPHRDSWGIAYWFDSINGLLGGHAPKTVLATNPQAVLRAAEHEIDDQLHPHG